MSFISQGSECGDQVTCLCSTIGLPRGYDQGRSEGPQKEAVIACTRGMTAACSTKQRGLRVDCIVELPVVKTPLWVDVGMIVHPEARSKLAQSMTFSRHHDVAERTDNRANNAFICKASPPVQTYVTVKDVKYKAMH